MTNLIIACLVSGLASLIIGAVWYNPKVFGTAWMKEAGITEEDVKQGNMPLIFGVAFLLSAYMAYEMNWINHPDEKFADILHGMYHGAKNIGIFAIGAVVINGLFERKSFKYLLINSGYWLTVFAVIGAILASSPSFKDEEKATEAEETGMNIELFEVDGVSYAREESEVWDLS